MICCAFNTATGVIRARFDIPQGDVQQQLRDGEDVYYGDADPLKHRMVRDREGWILIDHSIEDPGDGSKWDRDEGRWVPKDEVDERADRIVQTQLLEGDISTIRALIEYIAAEPGSAEESAARSRILQAKSRASSQREILRKRG